MTQPTYAELVDLIVEMRTELNSLRAENAALKVRVADLEARLRTNSQNSSQPPSSDGPATPIRSLRKPSKRKPGGQDGHRGQTLAQVADPDVVIRHEPSCCTGCGSNLAEARRVNCSRRQVFDIPPIKVHVTEHQIISRRCHCGTTSTGDVPAQASAPVQYGPVMCAVLIYLFMGQFLSKKRTAQAISELFAIPVSDGTVAAVTSRAAGDLTEFLAQVTARLKSSPVVHFDETGLRCQGRNRWLHSASTPAWTRLFFHPKRGTEAMTKMNILPGFTGTAVHDAWAPYDTYTAARHALCNAHLLRELQAVTDHHATTEAAATWCWAQQVSHALLTLHKAAAAHPDLPVDQAIITAETTKIRHALLAATHPDGATGAKHRALARRIHRREVDYLKFASDPAIPFTNNPAEQEIADDQNPAEDIGHHAHRKGSRTLRRPPLLPTNHRKKPSTCPGRAHPADKQKPLATQPPLTSYSFITRARNGKCEIHEKTMSGRPTSPPTLYRGSNPFSGCLRRISRRPTRRLARPDIRFSC